MSSPSETPKLLTAEGIPVKSPVELAEQECFESYTKLAARVTNLRTILQEPEVIQPGEASSWAEDVRSVVEDFVVLTEETRRHVLRRRAKGEQNG